VIGLSPNSLALSVIVTSGIEAGKKYAFRVRARNIFGWSKFYSNIAYLQAAKIPEPPAAPTTAVSSDPNELGGVEITWIAPYNNGEAITDYMIEIAKKGVVDEWATVTSCNGSAPAVKENRRCVVPMDTL